MVWTANPKDPHCSTRRPEHGRLLRLHACQRSLAHPRSPRARTRTAAAASTNKSSERPVRTAALPSVHLLSRGGPPSHPAQRQHTPVGSSPWAAAKKNSGKAPRRRRPVRVQWEAPQTTGDSYLLTDRSRGGRVATGKLRGGDGDTGRPDVTWTRGTALPCACGMAQGRDGPAEASAGWRCGWGRRGRRGGGEGKGLSKAPNYQSLVVLENLSFHATADWDAGANHAEEACGGSLSLAPSASRQGAEETVGQREGARARRPCRRAVHDRGVVIGSKPATGLDKRSCASLRRVTLAKQLGGGMARSNVGSVLSTPWLSMLSQAKVGRHCASAQCHTVPQEHVAAAACPALHTTKRGPLHKRAHKRVQTARHAGRRQDSRPRERPRPLCSALLCSAATRGESQSWRERGGVRNEQTGEGAGIGGALGGGQVRRRGLRVVAAHSQTAAAVPAQGPGPARKPYSPVHQRQRTRAANRTAQQTASGRRQRKDAHESKTAGRAKHPCVRHVPAASAHATRKSACHDGRVGLQASAPPKRGSGRCRCRCHRRQVMQQTAPPPGRPHTHKRGALPPPACRNGVTDASVT